jgi:kynurenine formamidase
MADRWIDLTLPVQPHFRWPVDVTRRGSHASGDTFEASTIRVSVHAFTHVDAPRHFVPGGRTIDEIPPDAWSGDTAVVNLTDLGANEGVEPAHLDRRASHVRNGDIVLLKSCWEERRPIADQRYWTEAPHVTRAGAEWLAARGARVVGYDFPPDYSIRYEFTEPGRQATRAEAPTHDVFLPRGILVIEYLTNLRAITAPRCRLITLATKLVGTDGAPARVIALVP